MRAAAYAAPRPPPLSSLSPALPRTCLAHAVGGVTTCRRARSRSPSTSLIARLPSFATHRYVAFAVATATACIENCLCVADAQVLAGFSNRSA